jgi:tRNA threonylcarbamoyladenosine biosynthesis protein TsaE
MGRTLELLTDSADETRAVGGALAALFGSGDVVSLTGDLGAGKTTFVQGAAAALEVQEPVLSPTFTLVREYKGAFPIYHVDVYRLDRVQDVLDLGFDEMLDRGAIVFVEWGDVIDSLLPDNYLQVEIQLLGETAAPEEEAVGRRRSLLSGMGESWEARWPGVLAATERWAVPREEPVGGAG